MNGEDLKFILEKVETLATKSATEETKREQLEERVAELEEKLKVAEARIAELEKVVGQRALINHADQVVMDNEGEVKHAGNEEGGHSND